MLTAKFYQPAFSHLAFSVAFAVFIFAEYIRYFALYPLGAAIHVFLSEFIDAKDRGTAILSHFYLLTGCAGSVWLEGLVLCFPFPNATNNLIGGPNFWDSLAFLCLE